MHRDIGDVASKLIENARRAGDNDVTTLMFAVADGMQSFDFYESDVNAFDVTAPPRCHCICVHRDAPGALYLFFQLLLTWVGPYRLQTRSLIFSYRVPVSSQPQIEMETTQANSSRSVLWGFDAWLGYGRDGCVLYGTTLHNLLRIPRGLILSSWGFLFASAYLDDGVKGFQ